MTGVFGHRWSWTVPGGSATRRLAAAGALFAGIVAGTTLGTVPASALPAGVASAGTATAGVATAAEGAACQVRYDLYRRSGGFVALATITNTGTVTVYGWTLSFPLPAGQQLTSSYNASYEMVGTDVAAHNLPDNGVLEPGHSIVVGFLGSSSSTLTKPQSFAVNGLRCSTAG